MKKFAAFLVILSIGLFTVGCGGAPATPKKEAGKDAAKTGATTPAPDAKDATKDAKK